MAAQALYSLARDNRHHEQRRCGIGPPPANQRVQQQPGEHRSREYAVDERHATFGLQYRVVEGDAGAALAELVRDALKAAAAARGGDVSGVIFHTDRGAQFTAQSVVDLCRANGLVRSMGRTGSCLFTGYYDWMESKS